MTVKKRQLDDYWWVVTRCMTELFGQTPQHAQDMVAQLRAVPYATQEEFYFTPAWEIAANLSGPEYYKPLIPEQQATYEKIVEETFGEDL